MPMLMELSTQARGSIDTHVASSTRSLIVALIFTISWFSLLAYRPLFEPDEGRYAEIPREMVAGGDWVTPHLNGLTYIEKPPLQYWLTAITFKVFGENDFTARLCTGLAGYLCILLIGHVAASLWGVRASHRALLLISSSSLYVLLGHQLTLDMTLSLWMTLCLCCFLLAQNHDSTTRQARLLMLASWGSMALAVLTKGLIGVVVPACTILVYALWQRDSTVIRRLNLGPGLALFGALTLPWFVLEARATPGFMQFFFVREHFQRFLTPIEHRSGPWWFFIPVLGIGILPWLPLGLRALLLPARPPLPRGQYDARRVLQAWCLFVLIFFSMSDAKLIPYILPAVPALVLLCASREISARERIDIFFGACLSLAAGVGIFLYADGICISSTLLSRTLRHALFPAALIVIVAGVLALCLLQKRLAASLSVLCVGWYCACGCLLLAAADAQELFSSRNVAVSLSSVPATVPIFSVRTYEQALPFYLGTAGHLGRLHR